MGSNQQLCSLDDSPPQAKHWQNINSPAGKFATGHNWHLEWCKSSQRDLKVSPYANHRRRVQLSASIIRSESSLAENYYVKAGCHSQRGLSDFDWTGDSRFLGVSTVYIRTEHPTALWSQSQRSASNRKSRRASFQLRTGRYLTF